MGILGTAFKAFKRPFDFKSRSSRAEYWWFKLFVSLPVLVYFVGGVALMLSGAVWLIEKYILLLALLFPVAIYASYVDMPLTVRRLHDIGKSGWWVLLPWASGPIGTFVVLTMAAQKGDVTANQYGESPLA